MCHGARKDTHIVGEYALIGGAGSLSIVTCMKIQNLCALLMHNLSVGNCAASNRLSHNYITGNLLDIKTSDDDRNFSFFFAKYQTFVSAIT